MSNNLFEQKSHFMFLFVIIFYYRSQASQLSMEKSKWNDWDSLHKMKQWKSDLKCHKFIANIEYYWFYVLYKEVTSTIHFRVLYIFWKSFAYNTMFFEISSILLTWKLPPKKLGEKYQALKINWWS